MKIKVGDRVELNNGEVCTVERMIWDDPLAVDGLGYGPFIINYMCYHQDGRFGSMGLDYTHSVKRVLGQGFGADDSPTIWRDMTDAEKGALLLADHEGKAIEFKNIPVSTEWMIAGPKWSSWCSYRIKPDQVREVVVLRGNDFGKDNSTHWSFRASGHIGEDKYRITFETLDGKPDCSTVKMEEL